MGDVMLFTEDGLGNWPIVSFEIQRVGSEARLCGGDVGLGFLERLMGDWGVFNFSEAE